MVEQWNLPQISQMPADFATVTVNTRKPLPYCLIVSFFTNAYLTYIATCQSGWPEPEKTL